MLIEHKTNQVLFFENLSIQNLFIYLFKLLKTSNLISLYKSDIYYIDITMIAKKIVSPLFNIIGINIKQLEFKMMDIHDDNGELVRIRLPRVDMFEIQDRIIHSNAYLSLQHESWSQDHIIDYLNKGLIDGGINVSSSVARIVYLIEVVAWYMKKTGCQSSIFIINSRPWLDVYKNIAYKKNISLVDVNPVEFKLSSLLNLIRSNAYLYFILKKLKYRKSYHPSIDNSCSKYKIYVDGRGDLDLSNNGEHTDFFWLLNSEFPNNSVLYECENMVEHEYLTKYGVCSIGKEIDYIGKASKQYEIPRINKTILFNKEKDKVKKELHSYNSDRLYWDIFF